MSSVERVHKYLTKDLTVRAAAVVATRVVEEMQATQNSFPISTVAVGRSMVASLLMASHLKNKQELSVFIQGSGPLSQVFAEASFEGKVRGVSSHPHLEMPIEHEKILVAPAIGIGLLTITHHLPIGGAPHRGTVELATSEIGDDIAYYLQQSHQIGSVVSLGVHVNTFGKVEAAGGILIELMPGHTEETVNAIEARVKKAKPISTRILEGATAEDLIKDYLGDFELIEMDHNYPIEYSCRCTAERVKRSVGLLGLEELDSTISKAEELEVSCEFCGRRYVLTVDDLKEVRAEVYKQSLN
ncbi:MAG: Hsp33 family molecular chaperone HslO [Bdellovibrionaceae bacterium]|nr:Hsp33 family molecular chaperone HslO [Pseudobdellovibrionaceae bacterium]